MRKEMLIKEIDDLIKSLNITAAKGKQHMDYYFFVNIAVKAEIEKVKFPDNTMSVASLIAALFAILISSISITTTLSEKVKSVVVGCAVMAILLILILIWVFSNNEKKNIRKLKELISLQELLDSYLKK